MKYGFACAGLVALAGVSAAFATSPVPDSPLGCPPSKTVTINPSGDAELVFAGGPALEPVQVAGPFDSPRSVAFLSDGRFLVAERPGRLQLVIPGASNREIAGVPAVLTLGHGGLIDLALDPEFATNGTIYLSYLHGEEAASTIRIMKARLDQQNDTLADQKIIFESTPGVRHEQLGGRMALTSDGYLFLSVGDRWAMEQAQTLADDLGSIVRIRTDGSIPGDNPFASIPGARPEIWSYGHRNPQGLAFDPVKKRLWSDEHGPQGGDELNLVVAGLNYGWPIITYGVDYSGRPIGTGSSRPGLEQPVRTWVPISIAPSGLAIEADPAHEVLWISSLAGQMLVKLTVGEDCALSEEHFLKNRLGRLRDVRLDQAGALYVLTDGSEGMLYRLDRTSDDSDPQPKTHL